MLARVDSPSSADLQLQQQSDSSPPAAAAATPIAAATRLEAESVGPSDRLVVTAKTSRYDFIKVRIWTDSVGVAAAGTPSVAATASGAGVGPHYHVLSRYLVARSLTTTLMGRAAAVRISLRCKKRLVDAGRLDITAAEWRQTLEEEVRREEEANETAPPTLTDGADRDAQTKRAISQTGRNMDRFKMIQWFQSSRTPLIILLYGNSLIGKSTLATKLCSRLNLSSVLQGKNAYRIVCAIQEDAGGAEAELETPHGDEQNEDETQDAAAYTSASLRACRRADPRHHLPLHLLPFASESSLSSEYSRRCRLVRRALQQDVSKALADGRSVIITGSLIDPNMFEDILPAVAMPNDDASPVDATAVGASQAAPILLSFHVTLPVAKQQLLLHNHFASATAAAAASCLPVSPAAQPHTASSASLDAASVTAAATTDLTAASLSGSPAPSAPSLPPPLSPAGVWRNLRWLEAIIAQRHQRWEDVVRARSASAASPASPSPILLPAPATVSLDPVITAADAVHAAVVDTMQTHAQRSMHR